ncbi:MULTISPECIES: gluconate 2-dehydrogenase subunit 3 family protein [unclassified Aureimonas]|uniref:gluconate 2-dehydrogenase subunit 3 family protein n=1 Tax=unclassified Aureimonas TaxID=2615206 RepID=UPI000701FD08|nr:MULTISPECIES: gluconate 2-dehydrogenase subunit 3 family protein [unclassified Aureimonas]KQT69913.1 hypothetical protein ASG62_02065 [Aureimonas sp. Leaf427]KQT75933.1 hypothetical protein ASG54_14155 [Aureimonas sp. Leaf460]
MRDDLPGEALARTRTAPTLPPAYAALIRSDRVSPHLRDELLKRARPDDPAAAPRSLEPHQFDILSAALDSIVPQNPDAFIDLAARLDAMMAEATGNGWRYEALPGDPDAYRAGLETLGDLAQDRFGQGFADLSPEERDAILRDVEAGKAGFEDREGRFDAEQMVLWFEELRSDAVRHYVAHPATMARLGYSGIANGGHGGALFTGFEKVGIGEREDFEPRAQAGAVS